MDGSRSWVGSVRPAFAPPGAPKGAPSDAYADRARSEPTDPSPATRGAHDAACCQSRLDDKYQITDCQVMVYVRARANSVVAGDALELLVGSETAHPEHAEHELPERVVERRRTRKRIARPARRPDRERHLQILIGECAAAAPADERPPAGDEQRRACRLRRVDLVLRRIPRHQRAAQLAFGLGALRRIGNELVDDAEDVADEIVDAEGHRRLTTRRRPRRRRKRWRPR